MTSETTGESMGEMTGEAGRRDHVAGLAARVAAHGRTLRAMGMEQRAAVIARAMARLAARDSELGIKARRTLPASTGLSTEMVDWALCTSLEPISQRALVALASRAVVPGTHTTGAVTIHTRPVVPRLVAVILAGNVFSAGLRPLLFPLCLGVPVVCKASSREQVFPALVHEALAREHGDMAQALGVAAFGRAERASEQVLLSASDAVVVYGNDATVQEIRGRAPASARVIAHGHGMSAAYVGASALASEERAARAAADLALDTAAYDQRGCLSPLVAWVRRGQAVSCHGFAVLLSQALDRLEDELPRGPLGPEIGAAQMQWRGVAAVQDSLFEGQGHAVAYLDTDARAPGAPIAGMWSPGWRNLLVLECDGPAEVMTVLAPWGVHLKAIGMACDPAEIAALIDRIPPPSCPRICPLGRMQTPPLDSVAEGILPFHDLITRVSVESSP